MKAFRVSVSTVLVVKDDDKPHDWSDDVVIDEVRRAPLHEIAIKIVPMVPKPKEGA